MDEIEEKDLSYFYYMWGRILFSLEQYERCIEKFGFISQDKNKYEKNILIFKAKASTEIENWKESYGLWKNIYTKYPSYDRIEVLKNIIWAVKNLDNKEELEVYKNMLLKYKFLKSSDNDLEILHII